MAAKSFIFLFLFYLNVSTKCDVVVNGLYRNVVKDNMPSNKDIFECFLNEDVISCVRGKAGKVLDVLEQDVNRQRKVWQKEADAEAAASGRSLKKMPSEVGEEVETTLKVIAQTMMGMARSIFNGGDDVIPASETEEDYSKSTMVDSLSRFSEEIRQLNKKGNGYMMLIGLGSLLVSKMMFFLNLVRLKLQFKFYLIALIALALNIARFLMEWQQKHHLQHGHLSHQKIVYREDEAIAGGYGGEEWKRTKEHEPWDEDDERYPYRGSEKINRIRQPPRY